MSATYQIFNIELHSQLHLPELYASPNTGATYHFVCLKNPIDTTNINWDHTWLYNDNQPTLRVKHQDDTYLLQCPELADFIFYPNQRRISCYAHSDTDIATIRHLLLDQIIPRIIALSEGLVLHASSVSNDNGLVALLGDSGSGKSTLAASLCQDDINLVADDSILVKFGENLPVAIPSYPGLRLAHDSWQLAKDKASHENRTWCAAHNDKQRLLVNDQPLQFFEPQPLQAIILLLPWHKDMVRVTPAKNSAALLALIQHTFVLDPFSHHSMQDNFQRAAQLVTSNAPIYQLAFPHQYDRLEEVKTKIMVALSKNNRNVVCTQPIQSQAS